MRSAAGAPGTTGFPGGTRRASRASSQAQVSGTVHEEVAGPGAVGVGAVGDAVTPGVRIDPRACWELHLEEAGHESRQLEGRVGHATVTPPARDPASDGGAMRPRWSVSPRLTSRSCSWRSAGRARGRLPFRIDPNAYHTFAAARIRARVIREEPEPGIAGSPEGDPGLLTWRRFGPGKNREKTFTGMSGRNASWARDVDISTHLET